MISSINMMRKRTGLIHTPRGYHAKSMIPAPTIPAAINPALSLLIVHRAFGFAERISANSIASNTATIPHPPPCRRFVINNCPSKVDVMKNPAVVRHVSHAGMGRKR